MDVLVICLLFVLFADLGNVSNKRSIKERLTDLPKTKAIGEKGILHSFRVENLDDTSDRARFGSYISLFKASSIIIDQLEKTIF